jgi:hypothetical protein
MKTTWNRFWKRYGRAWPTDWATWWEARRGTPRRLVGLSVEGGQLEAAVVERTNGTLAVTQTTRTSLALDPLTAEPELVGRELRQHLDAAGIRTRMCVLDLPLEHVLALALPLPDLPPEDQESLMLLEAERTFPHALDELRVATARFPVTGGGWHGMVLAISRERAERYEAALQAAQLRLCSVAPGLCALDPATTDAESGWIALRPVGDRIQMQICAGGALLILRTVEGVFEWEGPTRTLVTEELWREIRLSLNQLPPELQTRVQRLRVWGRTETATELAEKLAGYLGPRGFQVDQERSMPRQLWGLQMPEGLTPSVAVALAARTLAGQPALFEFLPPRTTAWQRLRTRLASRRLATAGLVLGGLFGLIGTAFLVQQVQLWYWGSQWQRMEARVRELETIQSRIRQYRPWFDESFRSLTVLKRLTEAFPEEGSVSAKTVEIRDNGRVVCTGTARDQAALLRALDRLRAFPEVRNVQVEQMRGNAPMQFTFNLQWGEGTGS